tara:strand:+ start:28 stop:270 length:243 start_codon:yes stop_codon:yes gene_type:complete
MVVDLDLQRKTKQEVLVDLDQVVINTLEDQVIHLPFLHLKVIQEDHNNGRCQLIQQKVVLVVVHRVLDNQDQVEELAELV